MVTLSDVTCADVLAATREFGRLGREAFLKSTGFGPARAYFLQHDGKLYDSKVIVGYAHGSVRVCGWDPEISAGAIRLWPSGCRCSGSRC